MPCLHAPAGSTLSMLLRIRTPCCLPRRPPGAPTVIEALPSPADPSVVIVKLEKPLYNNGRGEAS